MPSHQAPDPSPEVPSVPPEPPSAPRALSRWIAPVALVIAVIAVAVAVWALLRPPPTPTPAPASGQQTAAAKARACGAYTTVSTAVSLQTHADLGGDPVAVQAVAANARLSTSAGGTYLLAHLDSAISPDLGAAMRSFAEDLQDIAMNALAGMTNDDPAQAARLRDGETANARIKDLCK